MAESGRATRIAIWILSGLLAALFLFAGVPKILGIGEAGQHFAEWGYPAWFRILIGVIEVSGGIGLLISGVAFYAAGALGVVMIGAIYTILTTGTPGVAIPIVCLLLLGVIAYLRGSNDRG
jgi:putative oxidoreductase